MIAPLLGLLQAAQIATGAVPFEGGARNPAYARDGRLAVEARGDIWMTDAASADARWTRVTSGGAWDRAPAWTPDGKAIVFSSDREGGFDLWRIEIGQSMAQRLTTSPEPDGEPSVGGDGHIVFVRGRGVAADLWVRLPSGEERRLTREPGAERAPAISPDGKRVAYSANRDGGNRLRLIALDGTADRGLLAEQEAEFPEWSPDGARIAFTSGGSPGGRGGRGGGGAPGGAVWVTDTAGRYVNYVAARRAATAWSPDGRTLVLVEIPTEGGGGYNGDPDRIGDRDVGDLSPAVGRIWITEAPRAPDAELAELPIRATLDRVALNAEIYDRLHARVERVYYSTPDAAQRRAQWKTLGARHRPRALAAKTDQELDDVIGALWRERPPLRAAATGRAAVSSAHPVSTAAGVEILAKGGNVVDAAVAVSFALGVVEPDASGIGGYGQMLVFRRGMQEPALIEFMTAVPALASLENRDFPAGGRFPSDGPVLTNVPGTVAAMHLAWKKYGSGRVAWADLLAPAIRAAEEGYIVSDGLATTLVVERDGFMKYEGSRALFFRDGHPVRAGDTVKNPDLAWTLREIAKGGADAFYRGTVAQRMVDDLSKHGSAIRLPDLDRYAAAERSPVSGTFRGNAVYASGPPVAGGATLISQLNALELFTSPRPYTDDAASLHAVIEAWKLASTRGARIVDPALWLADVGPAVSKDSARARWACFDPTRASTPQIVQSGCPPRSGGSGADASDLSFAGAPWARPPMGEWSPECDHSDPSLADRICRSTGTTAFVVADADGNMVSTTQTLGTWGGTFHVSPGLGFLYNDKVTSYGTNATQPGARVTGARHGSTITPTIVFRGSGATKRPWFAVGAAGNAWITSAVYQTVVGIADGGLGPQAALELPRFQGGRGAGAVQIESGVSPEVLRRLEAMGHRFQFISLPGEIRQGYGAAVVIDGGRVTAGADPRRSGAAGAVPR